MISITKPHLEMENNKLYFSRKPGIIFWLLFAFTIIVSAIICRCLTNGVFLLTTFILGEIIFGLDAFGEWEELILDKTQNVATFAKNSWCDKLFTESPVKYSFKKLSDIRHIGVSQNMLFILPRNGKAITFGTRGLTRDEVQNIKTDIYFFLNLNRTECTGSNLLNISDSDQYLQNLLQKCNHRSNLQEMPFLIKHKKTNLNISVHQRQSSPLLGNHSKENPDILLKKRPCDTDNIQNIHLSYIRRRNSVPRR